MSRRPARSTGWALHTQLVHDSWDVDRDRTDPKAGDSPDVWAIIDEEGEEKREQWVGVAEGVDPPLCTVHFHINTQ